MDGGIYEPVFVRGLFNEMARTYGIINLITSFGFSARWRKQCLYKIDIRPGMAAMDLMTGMGELCPDLARRLGRSGSIRAIDLSPEMCRRARRHVDRCISPIEIIEGDVLQCELGETADVVVSSFGLKTFSQHQLRRIAEILARLLKPGGSFSFLEISVPASRWLRWPYMFYLKRIIPLLGKVLLGNPDNYRMLGVYTTAFQNCTLFKEECLRAGLMVQEASYFFGCATGVYGQKPLKTAIADS